VARGGERGREGGEREARGRREGARGRREGARGRREGARGRREGARPRSPTPTRHPPAAAGERRPPGPRKVAPEAAAPRGRLVPRPRPLGHLPRLDARARHGRCSSAAARSAASPPRPPSPAAPRAVGLFLRDMRSAEPWPGAATEEGASALAASAASAYEGSARASGAPPLRWEAEAVARRLGRSARTRARPATIRQGSERGGRGGGGGGKGGLL